MTLAAANDGEYKRRPIMHFRKLRIDSRSHQQNHVNRIRESLLIDDMLTSFFRRDNVSVVSHLNFLADFRAVGISSVHEKFLGAHPARIQVAHLCLEPALLQVLRVSPWSRDVMHIQPSGRADAKAEQQPKDVVSRRFQWSRRRRQKCIKAGSTCRSRSIRCEHRVRIVPVQCRTRRPLK